MQLNVSFIWCKSLRLSKLSRIIHLLSLRNLSRFSKEHQWKIFLLFRWLSLFTFIFVKGRINFVRSYFCFHSRVVKFMKKENILKFSYVTINLFKLLYFTHSFISVIKSQITEILLVHSWEKNNIPPCPLSPFLGHLSIMFFVKSSKTENAHSQFKIYWKQLIYRVLPTDSKLK